MGQRFCLSLCSLPSGALSKPLQLNTCWQCWCCCSRCCVSVLGSTSVGALNAAAGGSAWRGTLRRSHVHTLNKWQKKKKKKKDRRGQGPHLAKRWEPRGFSRRGLGARVLGGILGGRGRLPGPGALCRVISTHGQGPDVEAEEETPGVGVQKVWETTETSELERPRTGL